MAAFCSKRLLCFELGDLRVHAVAAVVLLSALSHVTRVSSSSSLVSSLGGGPSPPSGCWALRGPTPCVTDFVLFAAFVAMFMFAVGVTCGCSRGCCDGSALLFLFTVNALMR